MVGVAKRGEQAASHEVGLTEAVGLVLMLR